MNALLELLREGQGARAFPSASAWVALDGRFVAEAHLEATPETLWDLASLTKPMVTVQVALEAVSSRVLRLDDRVDDLPAWVTVGNLLGHRAGLPAWKDLVEALPPPRHAGSPEARYAVDALVRMAAREGDPGRGAEYSDLGYILLGRFLEARLGASLDQLVPGFRPTSPERCAPTGPCPWRGRNLVGEVHDPNAWVMGGVAGHAGLFATAGEVGAWALGLERRVRGESTGGRADRVDPGVLRDFWDPSRRLGSWLLGWDTPSGEASSAGRTATPSAVGHLGFTGTSVWIDRDPRLVAVLLTNRVALGAEAQPALRAFRTTFHDKLRALLGVV
jgi:CubicO group peptidase (beta-lactamase class C family)